MDEVTVERGSVLVYRMFDVAEAIDLGALEANARAATGSSRLRIARAGGQALIIKNAPVSISLGEHDVTIAGMPHRCAVQARVWDYGVISLQFRVPVAAMSWSALVAFAAAIENAANFDEPARQRLDALLAIIEPAVRGRHHWPGTEDHVIYFLEQLGGIGQASELLERVDVAALMLGEATHRLAEKTRQMIAANHYQYWAHDLTILDWNSALVVEPDGLMDVPDMIEFALTHLIELRYYDDLLDEKLGDLYTAISRSQRTLFRTNYARLSREASALFMDLTEFIERVENSLKVIGDYYLATIFRGTVGRLRLHEWEENVTRKLQILARVSELLSAQATAHQGHVLEWIVILLIAFEIVWALAGLGH
ncbi:MAG TPA: hypothetical protein VGF48_08070 [Thermoanaerobaculia bacterium]|jgi:hypothetical protein